jgi:hypothetical protein
MTGRPGIERAVTDWLHGEVVVERAPAVLAGALDRVADLEQKRGRRVPFARRRQSVLLAAAVLAAAFVIAVGGAIRLGPAPEAASAAVGSLWDPGDDVAFVVELPPGAPDGVRWRAAMFDVWSGSARAWVTSAPTATRVEAGASLLGASDEPRAGAGLPLTVTVRPAASGDDVISPGMPTVIDQPVDVLATGGSGSLLHVAPSRQGDPYTITGLTLAPSSDTWPAGPSEDDLRAATGDDPPGIDAQYAAPPAARELGAESMAFLDGVLAAGGGNRYGVVSLLEARLRGPEFTYAADTRDIDCGGRSFTECFLHTKRGYCVYFATAMTLLLREAGIPARIVMGFVQGDRVGTTETIRHHNASAWVEVYFPGWGWVSFDPTPSGTPVVVPLPAGTGAVAP